MIVFLIFTGVSFLRLAAGPKYLWLCCYWWWWQTQNWTTRERNCQRLHWVLLHCSSRRPYSNRQLQVEWSLWLHRWREIQGRGQINWKSANQQIHQTWLSNYHYCSHPTSRPCRMNCLTSKRFITLPVSQIISFSKAFLSRDFFMSDN